MQVQYKKGFTLVEIMIVVAIIGIIIAIAVPAFLRSRELSRARACQENLSKIDGAKEQYALENKVAEGGDAPTADDLYGRDKYIKTTPTCPGDDSDYVIGAIGTDPTCAYTGNADLVATNPEFAHVLVGGGEEAED